MADTAYSGPAPDFHSLPPRKAQKIRRQTLTELRAEAEAFVEHMLAVLDAMDGDPDLEPHFGHVAAGHADEAEPSEDSEPDVDGEPSLGSLDRQPQGRWAAGEDADHELDDSADEPSLGALSGQHHQGLWAGGGTTDAEGDEHDGREPEDGDKEPTGDEEEPSLGSPERVSQRRWGEDHSPPLATGWNSHAVDLEREPEANGRI